MGFHFVFDPPFFIGTSTACLVTHDYSNDNSNNNANIEAYSIPKLTGRVPLASELREWAKWECWDRSDADDDDEWESYDPELWQ